MHSKLARRPDETRPRSRFRRFPRFLRRRAAIARGGRGRRRSGTRTGAAGERAASGSDAAAAVSTRGAGVVVAGEAHADRLHRGVLRVELQSPGERHHQLPGVRQSPQHVHALERGARHVLRERPGRRQADAPGRHRGADRLRVGARAPRNVGRARVRSGPLEVHPGGVHHVQDRDRTRAGAQRRSRRVADRDGGIRRPRSLVVVTLEPLLSGCRTTTRVCARRTSSATASRPRSPSSTGGTRSSTTTRRRASSRT